VSGIPSGVCALLHLLLYLFLLYYSSSFFFFISFTFCSSCFYFPYSFLHHPTTICIFTSTTFFLYLCRIIIFSGMFPGE
jgi:hypothetical protein